MYSSSKDCSQGFVHFLFASYVGKLDSKTFGRSLWIWGVEVYIGCELPVKFFGPVELAGKEIIIQFMAATSNNF